MKPPLKLIVWEDAFNGDHEWVAVSSVPESMSPVLIYTVGFELRRDAERVTLCMSYSNHPEEPDCCDLFTIPIGMIRFEKRLSVVIPGNSGLEPKLTRRAKA